MRNERLVRSVTWVALGAIAATTVASLVGLFS